MSSPGEIDHDAPITTREQARERVRHLVGQAISHQLWLMMLDARGVPLRVREPPAPTAIRTPTTAVGTLP